MDDTKMELLITTNSEYELGVVKDILEKNEIPYQIHDRESGGYMRLYSGSSIFGTDIIVDKRYLEKAKCLINNFLTDI